jgi:DNA-binding transcriptional LysR family regulator
MLAPVSLDQLSYFVAVAEEGNIGRAARRLHISQPPLSRQIRSLEQELGISLFRRTTRGVQLLPAGLRLLPRARHILEAVANVRRLALADDPPEPEAVARGSRASGTGAGAREVARGPRQRLQR